MPTKLDPFFNFVRDPGLGGGSRGQGHGRVSDPGALRERHGRSESSPGHLKREGDSPSARDYAPGHTSKPDWADRQGRDSVLPEGAPDEMAKD